MIFSMNITTYILKKLSRKTRKIETIRCRTKVIMPGLSTLNFSLMKTKSSRMSKDAKIKISVYLAIWSFSVFPLEKYIKSYALLSNVVLLHNNLPFNQALPKA